MTKLVIFGGSGFLGRELIQAALEQAFEVISISRSGSPKEVEPWMKEVVWVQADVFEPETWKEHLFEADVVIDSIGIIRQKKRLGKTYQLMNHTVAKLLAKQASEANVKMFVYISAQRFSKFILSDYFQSKLEGEQVVRRIYPQALIMRPSFMYGSHRPITISQATILSILKKFPLVRTFLKNLSPQKVETVALETINNIHQLFYYEKFKEITDES